MEDFRLEGPACAAVKRPAQAGRAFPDDVPPRPVMVPCCSRLRYNAVVPLDLIRGAMTRNPPEPRRCSRKGVATMITKECFGCEKVTSHEHLHDCAPGIPETHMVGSVRMRSCAEVRAV